MLRYFDEVERLADVLLRGFSLALGLHADHLSKFFEAPLSRLKVNHYPPQRSPLREDNLGVVPHSDSGGFTILWQDNIGGLEVQNKHGEWVGAPPLEDTFVINIGNIMETWSNGFFSSTPHRVINTGGQDRYSIPLFVNPSADVMISPLIGDLHSIQPFHYGTYQKDLWQKNFSCRQDHLIRNCVRGTLNLKRPANAQSKAVVFATASRGPIAGRRRFLNGDQLSGRKLLFLSRASHRGN